jgi:hypothetical protein
LQSPDYVAGFSVGITFYSAIETVLNAGVLKASVDRHRRAVLAAAAVGVGVIASTRLAAQTNDRRSQAMEIVIDHVMFPVYFNNAFLEVVEAEWRAQSLGKVYSQPQNSVFKGVYFESKSFYVEYLSTVKAEPYWSNAVYVVVPKKYWSHYKNPALSTEHFLVPTFGCGYTLVSSEFPYPNSLLAKGQTYDGFTLLISKALEQELLRMAGQSWVLPPSGRVRVHEKLMHVYDIAVINDKSKLVGPLLQPNPILREFL